MDRYRRNSGGFTLIELMVVIAIVAIIAAIAIPAYGDQVRKSRRADAMQRIHQIALAQERFRAENPGYTNDWAKLGGDPDSTDPQGIGVWYEWTDVVVNNAVSPRTFTITATAIDDQAKDKARGTACLALTLDQAGTRAPAACWTR